MTWQEAYPRLGLEHPDTFRARVLSAQTDPAVPPGQDQERSTGRTTRMLVNAAVECVNIADTRWTPDIVILAYDHGYAKVLERTARDYAARLGQRDTTDIIGVSFARYEADWRRRRGRDPRFPPDICFFDHYMPRTDRPRRMEIK